MKILKYIFFFIVLTVIALTVFIATQNSDYTISKEKEINLPKHTVFNYLNNLKNYEQWQVFNEETTSFTLDSIYKGKDAEINWKNSSLKIANLFPNDSLIQNLNQDDIESTLKWKLKSTKKGTLVTLEVEGKMDFITKFKALFQGGIENINGSIFEKTLNSINHHLIEEYTKFTVKNEGIILNNETYFIKKMISCTAENLSEQIFDTMKSMKLFCEENDLKINGNPFTVFESINFSSGIVTYDVCLPITTEIFTNDGSDITGGKTESFHAYKTTLTGDYSHSDKAWRENKKGINENKLTVKSSIKPISIYKKSILDSNKPSEWVTEILTPVNESVIYIPETTNDSIPSVK